MDGTKANWSHRKHMCSSPLDANNEAFDEMDIDAPARKLQVEMVKPRLRSSKCTREEEGKYTPHATATRTEIRPRDQRAG